MGAASFVLEPAEALVWAGRPRLMTVLPAGVVGIALAIGGLVAATVLGEPLAALMVPVGVAVPAWSYLVVINTRYVVTERALYRKRGVLSRDVRRMGRARVQNSAFRQGVRGTLFGYGTVVVQVAGGDELRFTAIENPREVRDLVDPRDHGAAVPGTIGQWEAVLSEVRALRAALETHGR